VKCPKCGSDNKEGRRFCSKCGSKLENVCPECGFVNEPDDVFCGGCGAKLAESKSVPGEAAIPKLEDMHSQLQSLIPEELAQKYATAEPQAAGENRPVTALFADISGFTPMSATQSSETMLQLVQDCFRQLVGIVARYEGIISGFRGDGLLALFGAPILHENDAERAIRAAMDMRNVMHDRQLEVTIGINTAPMTVGEIQTQLHREYTAYGTDVILASRLQEVAQPGQILAGTGTHRLTRRAFDFEIVHDLELQGFPEPVTAYAVQRVKVHPEKLRGIEGLRARMIGREHEFAELKEAADEWLHGQGQMVCIIGEAGIGKSRLVAELRQYLDTKHETRDFRQEGDDTTSQESQVPSLKSEVSGLKSILEGRCVSIGQPISYWPFLDILRTYFGFAEDDTEAERAQKVRSRVEELLPNRLDDMLPFLGHLMNLGFGGEIDTRLKHYSAEQISHGTMMRLRELLVAMSEQQRLLVILEDLHWSDDLSLDLVSLLMDELMEHPLMLVCVYRPERKHRVWQLSSQAQRKCLERYTEVPLQKLRDAESRRLVQELLTIEDLPDSVREMILRKSEGNPFFIEEVIRSLIERGLVYHEDDRWKAKEDIVELEVPDTIQSVILARVDRLEAEARYVLQCASVIGRLFKHRLLEHLTQKQRELDRYIAEFEDRDLVYEERTIPELEYAFKHALTQEATYQGILEQRRKVFHRIVAQGIERLYQERIEDFYEELAYHWERSGDDEKTLEYLMKAGEKAAGNYLNNAAIDYYTRALQLAEEMSVSGDRLAEIYKVRGQMYRNMGFYEDAISDMEEAALNYVDGSMRAYAYRSIATIYAWSMSDSAGAVEYARRAVREIDPADKSREAAAVYAGSANILSRFVDLEEGELLLHKAVNISEEMGYRDLLSGFYKALCYNYNYYPKSEEIRKKILLAREKSISHLPYCKSDLSQYATICAELAFFSGGEERISLASEGLQAGIKSGNVWATVEAALYLGSGYQEKGEIQKAIEAYEQGWQPAVRMRHVYWVETIRLTRNLMNLHASRKELPKLHEMMLQMVDSTLELHSRSKVHHTLQCRWNGILEEAYEIMHGIAPEVYQDLKQSLESRLNETHADGERFFYHGQLAMLSMLDGRGEDLRTHAGGMAKLRSNAGTFAQRVPKEVEFAIELIAAPPDQHQEIAQSMLGSIDEFEDLQGLLGIINLMLGDAGVQAMDWDRMNQLALDHLQQQSGSSIASSWAEIERLYERYSLKRELRTLIQQVRQTMSNALQEKGIVQLLLEPVELVELRSPYFTEYFTKDPVKTGWEWANPAGDCGYAVGTEGYLQINVPPEHNLWPGSNYNAPRLLRQASGDLIIETRISSGSEGKKSGGLLIWQDKSNYIRFETPASTFGWEDTVYYEASISGKFIHPGVHPFDAEEVWLRLERRGDLFTGYVSADGENWYRCGWVDIPMEDPIKVGIHALCPQAPTTSTRFEYFRIHRLK
jgi:predicted ATPase/class 3 adenylate cyclase/regulation of enolase protein 1 (concanavalin A-like superfamily)